ncbi:glycoside hydrolase family 130 protein [Ferruginibacter sp.]
MKNILILTVLIGVNSYCQPVFKPLNNANSWQLGPFEKPASNPIMQADSTYTFNCPVQKRLVQWQKADVFNPAAVVRNGKVYILFRAEDVPGVGIGMRTSRIGLAESDDGIHFKKHPEPVLYPDSSSFMQYDHPGGCEDPRIVETPNGDYVVLYTSWNRDVARLSVATSPDLLHWKKQGPAFLHAYNGKFVNTWSKSGSVVTTLKDEKFVAATINGKYWMYWGEGPVYLATSTDLINWTPVTNDQQELLPILTARKKMFDSHVVEPGPPAVLTKKGIVLLYNGKNATTDDADPALPKGIYCGGQALFDAAHPEKLLERCNTYFIKPDLPHEISGQYTAGTTFIEGLVYFKQQYFLYYGTADSMVGVAIKK